MLCSAGGRTVDIQIPASSNILEVNPRDISKDLYRFKGRGPAITQSNRNRSWNKGGINQEVLRSYIASVATLAGSQRPICPNRAHIAKIIKPGCEVGQRGITFEY